MGKIYWIKLEDFGCEGDDFHEAIFTKLAGDWAEDAGAAGVVVFIDDDDGIGIEAEDGAIGPADGECAADDDGLDNGSFFHRGGGDGVADVGGDDIAHAGGAGALAEHADHFRGAGTGVISNGYCGFHLDHKKIKAEVKRR